MNAVGRRMDSSVVLDWHLVEVHSSGGQGTHCMSYRHCHVAYVLGVQYGLVAGDMH